ncbi:MAG TPA: exosortase-associated EpsI family protein [Armatimonadaceae bacterium]|nr:exosortase-associated EpsI family protein [Armatimonadaceae bacterium]
MNAPEAAGLILSILGIVVSLYAMANPKRRTIGSMALAIAVAGLLGSFATYRFSRAGRWLPPAPDDMAQWEAKDSPFQDYVLAMLGGPQARGREYRNPFGEVVYWSVVTAGPFENYHDPTVCIPDNGFALTAKREFSLDGPGSARVRAMIFKHTSGARMLMYYWTQNRDGSTATEARMGNYRDIPARFQTGYGAVVEGKQTVIVRIYTVIPPDEPDGAVAQYNLNEVSRATYRLLKADGRKPHPEDTWL